jgi:hypothetical protein
MKEGANIAVKVLENKTDETAPRDAPRRSTTHSFSLVQRFSQAVSRFVRGAREIREIRKRPRHKMSHRNPIGSRDLSISTAHLFF